jgi:hypothetical protein
MSLADPLPVRVTAQVHHDGGTETGGAAEAPSLDDI